MRMVLDSRRETSRVMPTPSRMTRVSPRAERKEEAKPPAVPTKNMVMMAIRVGNRPLQGTKLLVIVAMSRSLGESMMRQPTTPAALQPKPMHITKEIYATSTSDKFPINL